MVTIAGLLFHNGVIFFYLGSCIIIVAVCLFDLGFLRAVLQTYKEVCAVIPKVAPKDKINLEAF